MEIKLLILFGVFSLVGSVANQNDESLLVGAFNIQIYGQSKGGKDDVIQIIVQILARYDLIVVQEIRDSKETAFDSLIGKLNNEYGDVFDYVIGARVGRTKSKEQYGFVFRKDKVEIESMYEYNDQYDVFEGEPLIVRWRRIDDRGKQKSFTFIPMHAKPRAALAE
uniref:Endonuclease/exonuclease/phosphatase domain-containing protein n=1 Tax=Ciona savignyi TaxID=51511 RepID=H2Y8D5_CIOSA